MTEHEFTLRIRLGNAAMSNAEDISEALRDVASNLWQWGERQGTVRDGNGNRVGEWSVSYPPEEGAEGDCE